MMLLCTIRTFCRYGVSIIALWLLRCVSAQSCVSISTLPVKAAGMQLGYTADPNIVYLFGGMNGQYMNDPLSSIYTYNVNGDKYTLSNTSTPTTVFYTLSNNIVSVNDIIYFVGTPMPWPPHYAYAFDVTTETWAELSNPSHPAFYGCLTGNDTHLFFIGGVDNASTPLKGIQAYNIVSNSWSYDSANDLPMGGWQHGYCAMVNDDIYIFGGEGQLHYLDTIYKWNGILWNNIGAVLPQAMVYGIAVAHMDYIYIIGGMDSEFNSNNDIYEFDTTQDIITNTYQMQWYLDSPAAGIIHNKLYIFGGRSPLDGINDVQVCDILPT
eukprot:752123_1